MMMMGLETTGVMSSLGLGTLYTRLGRTLTSGLRLHITFAKAKGTLNIYISTLR